MARIALTVPALSWLLAGGCHEARNEELKRILAARCGDGARASDGSEHCDDGNAVDGDGCSAGCTLELGWTCSDSAPSSCSPICGDGLRRGLEACDDGTTNGANGCTSECRVRRGWTCDQSSPSMCAPLCGDGVLTANERCDDGNVADGDGCDAACRPEDGFACQLATGPCVPVCGDGKVRGGETCDDANTRNGDGCDALCVDVAKWHPLALSAAEALPLDSLMHAMGDEVFMRSDATWAPRAYSPSTGLWRFIAPGIDDASTTQAAAVWTGRELFFYGGSDLRSFFYPTLFDPLTNRWRQVTHEGTPEIEGSKIAVWTGRVVIVWGGFDPRSPGTGAMYDVEQNTWRPMRSTPLSPGQSFELRGVWTGTELVILSRSETNALIAGAYNPETDTWREISLLDAPQFLNPLLVTMADDKILVFSIDLAQNAEYRPSTDTWSMIPPPGLNHAHARWAEWTGSEIVVVDDRLTNSMRYIPATRQWLPIPSLSEESDLTTLGATSIAGDVFVHGETLDISDAFNVESHPRWYRLNTSTYSWDEIETHDPPAPRRAFDAAAIVMNDDLFVFGGRRDSAPGSSIGNDRVTLVDRAWTYSLRGGEWVSTSTVNQAESRLDPLLVWTGSEVIVWGGRTGGFQEEDGIPQLSSGGIYDPARKQWLPMWNGNRDPTLDALAVWSGREVIVWSPPGERRNDPPFAAYDPEADTWRPIPDDDAPEDDLSGAVLLGHELLFHGTSGLSRFDIVSERWSHVSMERSPMGPQTLLHPPVITSTNEHLFMLVGSELGRYDPARDEWQAIDVPEAHRPALERSANVIFTGAVIIFLPRDPWQGNIDGEDRSLESQNRVVGVVYDPASGRWWTTPEVDAPLVYSDRTYTWTGNSLIVWGGPVPGGALRF